MNRYIIVGPARSGTTVTHLCLAGHPNVSALNDEVKIDPFFTKGISAFTHGNDLEIEQKTGFLALFDTICTLRPAEEPLACGLKTAIITHLEAVDFVTSVRKHFPQLNIILTLRDDIVAQFGSLERAKLTGKWHSWVKQERSLEEKLQIDKGQLYKHAVEYLKTVRELQQLRESHNVFTVSYENDILPGDLDVYQQIFRFLNLPEKKITWLQSSKVAPAPVDFIQDYPDHAAFVRELRKKFETDPTFFTTTPDSIAENMENTLEKPGMIKQIYNMFFQDAK